LGLGWEKLRWDLGHPFVFRMTYLLQGQEQPRNL